MTSWRFDGQKYATGALELDGARNYVDEKYPETYKSTDREVKSKKPTEPASLLRRPSDNSPLAVEDI